jgi:hypothetical protein
MDPHMVRLVLQVVVEGTSFFYCLFELAEKLLK